MTHSRLLLALAALLSLFVPVVQAASADEVVAQARRYLGKERDLEAIRSIHYKGTIEVCDAAGAVLPDASGTIELIVQRPAQQLNVRTSARLRDTVGLDDFSGWQRVEPLDQAGKARTTILRRPELWRLQAVTAENLYFYRGHERRGGRIELRGESTIDGHAAVAVAFIHPHDIVFLRYFDKKTGRLLMTDDPVGGEVHEEGEMVVSGIRFPRRMRSSGKTAEGKGYSVTINFTAITVNETFPAERFAVPMFEAK